MADNAATGSILSPDVQRSLSPLFKELQREAVARARLENNAWENAARNAVDVYMEGDSEISYMEVSGVQGQEQQSHRQLAPFGAGAHDSHGREPPPDTKTGYLGVREKKIKKKHRVG